MLDNAPTLCIHNIITNDTLSPLSRPYRKPIGPWSYEYYTIPNENIDSDFLLLDTRVHTKSTPIRLKGTEPSGGARTSATLLFPFMSVSREIFEMFRY